MAYQVFTSEPTWFTSIHSEEQNNDNVLFINNNIYFDDMILVVEPNTGSVVIQVKDSSGNWFTPNDINYTIDTKTLRRFNRRNMPTFRILAKGDATFSVYGGFSMTD